MRNTPDKPPFSTIGIYFLGAITIKLGRNDIKHYGCVLPVSHLVLSTWKWPNPSMQGCSSKHIAYRNRLFTVYFDNGSNFVGAQRELKEAKHGWNQAHLEEFMH